MMCFVAVIVVTGLVVGLGILGRNIHSKSHKCSGDECSGDECSISDYSPPSPFQIPFPSLPNYNPSDPTASSTSPPPPPETYLSPPICPCGRLCVSPEADVHLRSTKGCILGELYAGKPIMPGRTEVEQLHKVFKLCGSASDNYWITSKLPHSAVFKPVQP
ncbi:hypothetical protein L1987_29661 [Smallanthus sonchifolius]|uniref:Uncharacterized protein n=1 Tax=Smallanthus sonchifolius TaxID=185202 RepID=A0ACB9I1F9_9ASTR|nr:hypothetical protein L1987_29661 [Smallanthus sonchifolius]